LVWSIPSLLEALLEALLEVEIEAPALSWRLEAGRRLGVIVAAQDPHDVLPEHRPQRARRFVNPERPSRVELPLVVEPMGSGVPRGTRGCRAATTSSSWSPFGFRLPRHPSLWVERREEVGKPLPIASLDKCPKSR